MCRDFPGPALPSHRGYLSTKHLCDFGLLGELLVLVGEGLVQLGRQSVEARILARLDALVSSVTKVLSGSVLPLTKLVRLINSTRRAKGVS